MHRAVEPAKAVMAVREPNHVGAIDSKREYLRKPQLLFPGPVFPDAIVPTTEPSGGAEPQTAVRSLGKTVDAPVQQSLPDSPGFKTPILEHVCTRWSRIHPR